MAALETKLQQAEQKNAELTARLEIRERINGALVNQLENENRRLQEERERLQNELQELGKALSYTISQWDKLARFLQHSEVPAHNNRVENDIRPFAVGRRAWLFIDTQLGARASANLYSMAITCRANGINALAYFTHLYERLPFATTAAELDALLPWNVKPLLNAPTSSAA